jgi:hypothetical protein
MNGDERGPWYLLTGLVIGIALGLFYAWAVQPVQYVDTAPDTLQSNFKDHYRALIASAYLGNEDLLRARARLELLHDEDVFRALTEQAQRTLAENGSDDQARALGLLAIALGQAPPGPAIAVTQPRTISTSVSTRTPGGLTPTREVRSESSPTPTRAATDTETPAMPPAKSSSSPAPSAEASATPSASPTAPQTAPPTLTPGGPFVLLSQEKICDPPLQTPLFQIEALDRFNQPIPGVLVIITWPGGEERFLTGLKPEKGAGYADFVPATGVLYSLRLGENGQPVNDLAAPMCPRSSGAPTWGAWLLKFVRP